MHKYLFNNHTRQRLGLPQPSELGTLFSIIAVAGNFLMSMKEIQLGKGLMVYNDCEGKHRDANWNAEGRVNNSGALGTKPQDAANKDGEKKTRCALR